MSRWSIIELAFKTSPHNRLASVMAIESEVFGSCVGEIFVSLGFKNAGILLCCGLKYLGFILAGKAAQYLGWWWEMVPGIGGRLGALGLIGEIKSPCGGSGLCGIRKSGNPIADRVKRSHH